jgi:DNA-binding transcriptional ArsR family regulator
MMAIHELLFRVKPSHDVAHVIYHGLNNICGMSRFELDFMLRGRAWQVYWCMLSKGSGGEVTVREVQRELAYKSPSIAAHHLERLRDLGLVTRGDDGGYVLVGEVKLGVLRHFVRLGRILVPRFVFYASFDTMLTLLYLLFLPGSSDLLSSSFVIIIGVFSSTTFWYEAYRFWRLRPY